MRKMKVFFSFFLMMSLLIVFMPAPIQAAAKISAAKVSLTEGETVRLKVTGTKETVTWSTSKRDVATVTQGGKVTAKAAGKSVITASFGKNSLKCTVTVLEPMIELSPIAKTLTEGASVPLNITGTKETVTWSTSKRDVATVTQGGTVTAKSAGIAEIIATVGTETRKCIVKVVAEEKAQSFPKEVHLGVFANPQADAFIKLIDDYTKEENGLELSVTDLDTLLKKLEDGTVDIAPLPANDALNLYQKIGDDIVILAINGYGEVGIYENGGPTIYSIEGLKGRTIYCTSRIRMEPALNYVLLKNGIGLDEVNIVWIGEDSKVDYQTTWEKFCSEKGNLTLLPQQIVSSQSDTDHVAKLFDVKKEWEKTDEGAGLIFAVLVARRELVEQYPAYISQFLADFIVSKEYVQSNPAEASKLIEQYGIQKANIAEVEIHSTRFECVTGDEMKKQLSGYYKVLQELSALSDDMVLPKDTFYYISK